MTVPIRADHFEDQLAGFPSLSSTHPSRRSLSLGYRVDSDILGGRPNGLVTSPTHARAAKGGRTAT
jgi:hypothetical protein